MHSFTFICTERSTNSVYLCSDHVKAIGLLPPETEISYRDTVQAETHLISGRNIPLREEEIFILMNDEGALLVCQAKEIRDTLPPPRNNMKAETAPLNLHTK